MSVATTRPPAKRDYRLIGPEGKRATDQGLTSAQWFTPQLPRAQLKELMRRRDGPAIRDTLIWFAGLGLTG